MTIHRVMALLFWVIAMGSPTLVFARKLVKEVPLNRVYRQLQLTDVEIDEGGSAQLQELGCFGDKSSPRRALRELLGYSSGNTPKDIIKDCTNKAVNKGYVYFGVQYGKECWSDKEGYRRYDMYSKANNCVDGLGSGWSNYVYKITKVPGYCVTHFQLHKYNTLVNEDDPCDTCKCESSGHVICQHKTCPLLPRNCEKNVTLPGKCCPVCECYHHNTYSKNGDTWSWGCEQCSCVSDQAHCTIQPCPVCSSYVDQPGQCCRACATEKPPITFTIIPTTEAVWTLPMPSGLP